MTENERAAIISYQIWSWIQKQERIELVPWITDPKSERYDAVGAARQEGYMQCLKELKTYIVNISNELKQV